MYMLDLFSGVGGWDVAANQISEIDDLLGIELEKYMCDTRQKNNLPTVQAEVSLLDPTDYPSDILVASPPCQGFSKQGHGKGRLDKKIVYQYADDINSGLDTKNELFPQLQDKRSLLVVEPLRFVLEAKPKYVAFEQVPYVKELWEYFAKIMKQHGYSTWVGNLEAEEYGSPQTRKRAILMASTEKDVAPPTKTHQRFLKSEIKRGDLGVLPWVSLEDRFPERKGWSYQAGARKRSALRKSTEPAPTIAFGYDYNNHGWRIDEQFEKLTEAEGLKFQGFPDNFQLCGSKHSRYTQIGNAIPVELAKSILEELIL